MGPENTITHHVFLTATMKEIDKLSGVQSTTEEDNKKKSDVKFFRAFFTSVYTQCRNRNHVVILWDSGIKSSLGATTKYYCISIF